MLMKDFNHLKTLIIEAEEPWHMIQYLMYRVQKDLRAAGKTEEEIMLHMFKFGSLVASETISESLISYASCDVLGNKKK